jgi:carbamoyl-phosphate synthase large subunit
MSLTSIPVLMTGGGAPGAAGIASCLSKDPRFLITISDANPEALGKHLGYPFINIPLAMAPLFAESVLAICREKKIRLVLPLVTRELVPLAMHKEVFEKAGVKIPVSSVASLEIANNKSRLYQFLQWRSIDVPEFRVVETIEQFTTAVRELGYPEKPVCFKPSVSNGSRGFRILSEQMNELDLLFNYKPESTYMTLDTAKRILSAGTFPELLVSEWLPGDEFSVDCLANDGEARLVIPRLRKKMIGGISVEGEFIKAEELIRYCSTIIRELQLHGNIGIQVKKSDQGHFRILEINPRVQGSIAAAVGAGVNLPVLAVKQELGLPILPEEMAVRWGTRFSKYWTEIYH